MTTQNISTNLETVNGPLITFKQVEETEKPLKDQIKLKDYLIKEHHRLEELKKWNLKAKELITAIKYLGYDIKKDIRNQKSLLYQHSQKVDYFNDDNEAKFIIELQDLLAQNSIEYSKENLDLAIRALRADSEFCPLREKLESLKWDGIERLNANFLHQYFSDVDGWFADCLKAFLVGSIGRVFNPRFQSPVWILAGGQGLGKSFFTHWLSKSFGDEFHGEKAIIPEEKDSQDLCCTKLIIEIPESGGTFKKDREILKRHFTTAYFEIRNPYGKYNVQRPHLANYIATLNLTTLGILKDPTGSRRFIITEIEEIKREYSKDIFVNDLWAEAFHLYKNKAENTLNYEPFIDTDKRDKINERYSSRPLEYEYLDELIAHTGNDGDRIKITDLIEALQNRMNERKDKAIYKTIIADYFQQYYKIKSIRGKMQNGSTVDHYRGIIFTNLVI
jgi:predicted P-loop ATPase